MDSQASDFPSIWARSGILAAGILALAGFVYWPLHQSVLGEPSVTVSFKGILLGAMLTAVGLNLVFLGEKGIPWKKTDEQPLTVFQKLIIAATVAAGLLMVALVWYIFNLRGYTMTF